MGGRQGANGAKEGLDHAGLSAMTGPEAKTQGTLV
jgi:hypothetical protein